MIVLLIFAFISGLVTIFAPCIWPLLPIILSSSTTGGRRKPLGITVGIMVSFAVFTLTISYLVRIIPFDPNVLRLFAVIVIGFLGLTLIIPRLSQILEGYVSRLSGRFGRLSNKDREGFGGGFVTGAALGLVWSPCAGPILATIAALAATRTVNAEIVFVTIAYVLGVGIPLFFFATAGSYLFTKSRFVSRYTGHIQQVFGAIMILTAIAIYTNYDKVLQVKLLDAFPSYTNFLNELEGNPAVSEELDKLRGGGDMDRIGELMPNIIVPRDELPDLGKAPDFTGINTWLNTDEPVTMQSLRGKVVLIDFWTYTCINCIRTLPHVTRWYEKYKDDGLVVVGVHTPEFEFEKQTTNVKQAINQYNITYPVAQDNDYSTWRAYNNRYWPAKYLIDAKGRIRYTHFGEGEYEKTEKNIQKLLKESGAETDNDIVQLDDKTPRGLQTPETYLGSIRMERFASPQTPKEHAQQYTIPKSIPQHYFAYEGAWEIHEEYSQASQGSALELRFYGSRVFLVITPAQRGGQVAVYLDGVPIRTADAGADVLDGILNLDTDRLYELVKLNKKEGHKLRLEFSEDTQIFAFTFG